MILDHRKKNLISTKAPQVVGLPQFQGAPLWEGSLWTKFFRCSVAERARLPQGTPMQRGVAQERIPCGAFVIIRCVDASTATKRYPLYRFDLSLRAHKKCDERYGKKGQKAVMVFNFDLRF